MILCCTCTNFKRSFQHSFENNAPFKWYFLSSVPVLVPLHGWTCTVRENVLWKTWFRSYHSSSFVVVPVHGGTCVWTVFSSIRKLPGYKHPEFRVFTTAAPFPALTWWPFVMGITATHGRGSFCTGPCHCKCHTSGGDCMDKCRLSSG